MILREYQTKAVNELEAKAITLLGQPEYRKKLVFKAPTGAGKTVMMAAWLQRMAQNLPAHYELPQRRIAYLWIAPNQLHEQSLLKLRSFFEATRALRCLQWQDLTAMALLPNEILFFNWQSISREDALIIKENESGRHLDALIAGTRAQGVELVIILDEAHLFATKGEKALKLLDRIQAKIEIDVSATPWKRNYDETVTVHRQDVVASEMIKERVELNPAVKDKGDGTGLNEYLLNESYRKLLDLRKRYQEAGSPVRPLLLVQLPSETKTMSNEDRQVREMVEQWLSIKDITLGNGKLAVWLSNETKNLEKIEENESIAEVLLFKQAIALGWDCPRAAVLVIFREIKSETFTIQTVGRILRMPEHKHYRDTVLNQGYVYTNLSKDRIQVVADDADYLVDQRGNRIPSYTPLGIQSAHIHKRVERNRLNSRFRKVLSQVVQQRGWKSPVEDVNFRALNATLLWNWQLDVKAIDIVIPKDVYLTGAEQTIAHTGQTRYARTTREMDSWLHRYCLSAVGEYAKIDSAPVLKMSLLMVFEEFLDADEPTTAKIVFQNETHVQELIDEALLEYRKQEQERAKTNTKVPEKEDWEVPLVRLYPEGQYIPRPSTKHVLQAFFENTKAKTPEQNFVKFLEEHRKHLRWWYKNGDSGKTHFAVPYQNVHDEWSLFYVDFILLLSDGTVALFDTKTIGSDSEAARKHNALLEYLQELRQRYPTRRFIGGVLIQDRSIWRYSLHRLENDFQDTEGWQAFDPTTQTEWPDFNENDYEPAVFDIA